MHTAFLISQDNLLLDMYLAPHVLTLYTLIRNRALIQVRRTGEAGGQEHFSSSTPT